MCDGTRGRRRLRRGWATATLALALAALVSGCLDDGAGTGPTSGPARLALTANVAGAAGSAAAVTALGVEVLYVQAGDVLALLSRHQLPLDGVSPGGTVTRPLTVELGPCLAGAGNGAASGSCTVFLRVSLLAGTTALDVITIGPVTLRPGQTADLAEVTLHTVGTLSITPGVPPTLIAGQSLQLTGRLTDASGADVEGRVITWSSSAPSVATVDATGKVAAIAPGSAIISATGADRNATVLVRVVPRTTIELDQGEVKFTGRRTGAPPQSQLVKVTNGVYGSLEGLELGAISYVGTATGWLSASIASAAAPTWITLRPTRTDLAPGSYTALVPVIAPTADNSGITVRVTYIVTDATSISLDRSVVEFTADTLHRFETVGVTAAGPLGGLDARVRYGVGGSGWLEATLSSSTAPASLQLVRADTSMLPGMYSAEVLVTAPGAANEVSLPVVWTVPKDDYSLSLWASPGCLVVGDSSPSSNYAYVGVSLERLIMGQPMDLYGVPYSVRPLGPGITVDSDTGSTDYYSYVTATATPGFLGETGLVVTIGRPPHPPLALSDTIRIEVRSSFAECTSWSPGLSAHSPPPWLRRAPVAPSAAPAAGGTPSPRARMTAPAPAASPASRVSTRSTPEKH